MAYSKCDFLKTTLMLIIICVTLVNAHQERSQSDFELYSKSMEHHFGVLIARGGGGECTLTFENYIKLLILCWDDSIAVDQLVLPYHNEIIASLVPGDGMKTRFQYCLRATEMEATEKGSSSNWDPNTDEIYSGIEKFFLDDDCYNALEDFGDEVGDALNHAIYKKSLEDLNIDVEGHADIAAYLLHISGYSTYSRNVPEPVTYCKYVDWKEIS